MTKAPGARVIAGKTNSIPSESRTPVRSKVSELMFWNSMNS